MERELAAIDAIAVYFRDAALAAAFVSRWCQRQLPEIADRPFLISDEDRIAPQPSPLHKTP
jgi:hypothetical protein